MATHSRNSKTRSVTRRTAKTIAGTTALVAVALGHAAHAQDKSDATLSFMVFNIWNQGTGSKIWDQQALADGSLVYNDTMKALLQGASPDVLVMPELYNNNWSFNGRNITDAIERNTLDALNELPENGGDVRKNSDHGSNGSGMMFSGEPFDEVGDNAIRVSAGNGFPDLFVLGRHLNYYDEPTYRIDQAREINDFASNAALPTITLGDLNAGDLSERGLLDAFQQATLFARVVTDAGSSQLWQDLAQEYIPEGREAEFNAYLNEMRSNGANGVANYRNVIDAYFQANRDEFPGITSISQMSWRQWEEIVANDMADHGLIFEDETYPVASNLPVTMNILKRRNQLLQLDRNRELFAPSEVGDGRATWTSDGEEDTNTWESWDRVNIDHIMASRPFAKWMKIVDRGEWSGNLTDKATLPDGGSLSDHEPVALDLAWVGPALETYEVMEDGRTIEKTRLIWGEDASIFDAAGGEFLLTRNNMRDDVYLGQIADENGMPILTGLTIEEKKSLLDCASDDARFAQAIADYCIDDHGFIGETRISDDGTLVILEDAALGDAEADLVLDGGNLRVAGSGVAKLDRSIMLDGEGGGLDIDQANHTVVVDTVISGAGNLSKLGLGTLKLENEHDYTGETRIDAGMLVVDGSIASSSNTIVGPDGALSGSGTVGNLTVGEDGVLSPGNSVGTLSIDGDLTFENGAAYLVEVDPEDSSSDRIEVSGTTTLNGGSVAHIGADGDYRPSSTYRILTSAGGIDGEFAEVTSNYAFLDPFLLYGATAINLRLDRNATEYVDKAATENQRAAAAGIASVGAGNALYDAVVVMPDDPALLQAGFDSISGEIQASTQSGLVRSGETVRGAVNDRLRSAFGTEPAISAAPLAYGPMDKAPDMPPAPASASNGIWGSVYGSWAEFDAENGTASFTADTGGIIAGLDGEIGGWQAGLLAGYSQSDFDLGGRSSTGSSDNLTIGAYGGTEWGAIGLRAGVTHSWHDVSTSRNVAFGGFFDTLDADYNARSTQVFGELGYGIDTSVAHFEPFVNLAHVSLSTDGYNETGGAASLSSGSTSMDTTFTTLGVHAEAALGNGPLPVKATGTIGWRHAFGDIESEVTHAFAAGDAFTVTGAAIAENAAIVEAGIEVPFSANASLDVTYQGQFASEATDHGLTGKFTFKF